MERQEQQTKQIQAPKASEDQTQATTAEAEHEETVMPTSPATVPCSFGQRQEGSERHHESP